MATLEAGRWTKFLTSNTSYPYDDGDYYYDMRGGLSITYELNSAKTGYVLTIAHKVQGKQDVSGISYSWSTTTVSSKVNGNTAGSFSGKPPISYQTLGTKTLGTSTYTVPLASDGTCSCTITCTATDGSHTRSWQVKYTLPTVILNSTISNNSSSSNYIDFGSSVTFSITRPSTETHTLTYAVNGTTYTIGSGIETSKSYAFPTSLVNSYPSNEYVSILVTCTSSNGTSCSTTVYLHIPSSYVPSCSLSVSDVGDVPSSWGIWLKSKSKIKGVITASGSGGSSIKSYSSSANNSSYSSSTFTTDYLKNSGSQTISSTATDTRNRSKSASKTISVIDYWTPSVASYSVVRCLANGTENNDGTYGKVKCTYSIAPCSNKNAKSLVVKYGSVSKTFSLSSYSGTIEATSSQLFSGLATGSSHAFEFYLIDTFETTGNKFNYTMPPSFVTISYLHGGKGITIGQIATKEGLRIEMDAYYKGSPLYETETVEEWND